MHFIVITLWWCYQHTLTNEAKLKHCILFAAHKAKDTPHG